MNFRIVSVLSAAMVISGCAASQQLQAKRARFEGTIPTCGSESECREKWSAAQAWVVNNSGMKIQIATDTIIETFNPVRGMTNLAARVVKEPLGGGKYRMVIRTWCDNMFVCSQDPWTAALNFNDYVNRFGPQPLQENTVTCPSGSVWTGRGCIAEDKWRR